MHPFNPLKSTPKILGVSLFGSVVFLLPLRVGAAPVTKTPPPQSRATQWRSTLYPSNWTPSGRFDQDKLIQDFSYAGYHQSDVPIPQTKGLVFDAVAGFGADSTGTTDSTSSIQKAIDQASLKGGVVYLRAGTFKITPQAGQNYALRIAANNVVLRGAGKDKTFLFNDSYEMRSKQILLIQGSGPDWHTKPDGSPETLLTRDLLTPTTLIPVASVAGFQVGDWITLRADATDAFAAEHHMADLWDGKGDALGGVMFQRRITAIDAANNTLSIDVPLRYYLKMRDHARVHKTGVQVEEVGVESLSVGNREHPGTTGWTEDDYQKAENSSYAIHGANAITFERARNCWMRDVASYHPSVNTSPTHILSNGILLHQCRGVTVENCDFEHSQYGGGGGNGYMYRLTDAQECLLNNCISRYTRHGFVFSSMACSGNVIHGGLSQLSGIQAAGTGKTNGTGSDHHMHLSQSNLIDNMTVDRDYFTAAYRGLWGSIPHGQTSVHSVFWNTRGLAYSPGRNFIVQSEQARFGYVIGTRGPANGVSLHGQDSAGNENRMLPTDHVEGVGKGNSLIPNSLYLDQLNRRHQTK